jgi:large subunit ribosomal protein L25
MLDGEREMSHPAQPVRSRAARAGIEWYHRRGKRGGVWTEEMMATQDLTLTARPRELTGKKVGRLRREGLLPAVVYGPGLSGSRVLQLPVAEFQTVYRTAGTSRLIRLQVDQSPEQWRVFIKTVQYDLLKRRIEHVDFYAANLREETTVAVPVVLTGEAPIAARGEAVVSLQLTTLDLRALPMAIPPRIEIDISRIESPDDDIRVGDVPLPEGVSTAVAPETVLVSVTRVTTGAEEPVAAEAVPTAEPAATTDDGGSDGAR